MCNNICCETNKHSAISTATISVFTCIGGTTQIVFGSILELPLLIGTGIIMCCSTPFISCISYYYSSLTPDLNRSPIPTLPCRF
jgi:hypothetical protein